MIASPSLLFVPNAFAMISLKVVSAKSAIVSCPTGRATLFAMPTPTGRASEAALAEVDDDGTVMA